MGKRGFTLFLAFLIGAAFLAVFSQSVSASFACGYVGDSAGALSGWAEMEAYYAENPEDKVKCKVSPSNNKFCCDLESIPSGQWAVGKEVVSEMSMADGFFVEKASIFISGEGYDVFPDRDMKKAITINSAPSGIVVNESEALFDVSIDEYFDKLEYRLLHNGEEIFRESVCEDCSGGAFNVSLPGYGDYEIIFNASSLEQFVEDKYSFSYVEYMIFERRIECDRCRGEYVPRNKEVDVAVSVNLSHEISGIFADYFPKEWEYLGASEVTEYSESHNKIEWEINGSSASGEYKLRSPGHFFPVEYFFFSSVNDRFSDVFGVYVAFMRGKIFARPSEFFDSPSPKGKIKYLSVSESFPILMKGDGIVSEVAIFPSRELKNVHADFILKDEEDYTFEIKSNIRGQRFDKVMIRFTADKGSSPVLLYDDGEEWEEVAIELYNGDEGRDYYEAYHDKLGIFSLRFE